MKKLAFVLGVMALPLSAAADPVGLTPDMLSATVPTSSGMVEIMRNQDNAARLDGDWTLTSRPCPNFCIQPMVPAPGVTPIGELEVIAALQDPDTVVADGRIRAEFEAGTIPGAVSVPYTEAADRLGELGCA
ncbi:MAG: rhodanese-like domain-containing protein, partial [Roseicyclus sp.]|uniref:rhodanese-like domain-containing protein n=1 Tax=Roseicyclus sp. TaxID=1914329 RepID=UPI003BB06699